MSFTETYDSCNFSEYFKIYIPIHWVEKRLGYLAEEDKTAFVDGPFGSDLKTSDYTEEGVPLIQLNNIRDSKHLIQNLKFVTESKKEQLARHVAKPGDVVIAKMAEPVARAAVVSVYFPEYVIVADCIKMTPNLKMVNLNFLVWAINCDYVRINAELVSTGTTRIRINLGELKKLKIPFPPFYEQKQIANFLDYEIAKIDILIEKQKLLIKLLKEKRQVVISHAVTKGLNPDAPLKDSGVEWLGGVPEHWGFGFLRRFTDSIRDGTHNPPPRTDGIHRLLSVRNIIDGEFRLRDDDRTMTPEAYVDLQKSYTVKRGDVVLAVVGGTIGKSAVIGELENVTVQRSIAIIRLRKDKYDCHYLNFFLQTSYIQNTIKQIAEKYSAQPGIYLEDVGSLIVAFPSLKEQKQIVCYLDKKIKILDKVIEKVQSQISLLTERRTALISAVVTGKIDVRNWQPPQEN